MSHRENVRICARLPPRAPGSGFDGKVRLSRIIAVGWPVRAANPRNRMRRSSTMIFRRAEDNLAALHPPGKALNREPQTTTSHPSHPLDSLTGHGFPCLPRRPATLCPYPKANKETKLITGFKSPDKSRKRGAPF